MVLLFTLKHIRCFNLLKLEYIMTENKYLVSTTINPKLWVSLHADYLYAYAITRVNDQDKAKDLVQETFLAALKYMDKFEGKSSERTWLTAILKNKIIDGYRKKGNANITIETSEQIAFYTDKFFDPEDGHWSKGYRPQPFGIEQHDPLQHKEFMQVLQKCMKKLPVLWISVFTMKHLDDSATDDICSELQVTQANYWVIIHRAKLSLRACLQKNWI